MAQTAGSIIDSIARRVRDASNTAHSRTFVLSLISRMQVLVNAQQQYIVPAVTLVTTKGKALYSLESDLPSLVEITDVRRADGSLDELNSWQVLWKLSPTWLTDIGTPYSWAKIGRSLLALYPAPDTEMEITVSGTKITTTLSDESQLVELRDEDIDIVKEIVVALLLLRQRDLDTASLAVVRGNDKTRLQLEDMIKRS